MYSLENEKDLMEFIKMHRRNLHKIPELQLNLPQTVKYVKSVLDEIGIDYEVYEDISCIVGIIKGKEGSKTLAIRADMDALPIKEETGLEFCSTNENMHACGHDGHTAILLGTAKYLKEHKDDFCGTVKLLFQAGEEYPGGAKPMIERGAMQNPKVDAVIGLHQGYINSEVSKGKIGIGYGPIMASMDRFLVKVIGKGSHGAYPQNSIDSISIAAEIVGALNKIVSREIVATEPCVLSVCRIQGGYNQNILPDEVELEGTVRTTNEETRQKVARRIKEISQSISTAFGAKAEVIYDFKYPVTANNIEFTKFFENIAQETIGKDNIVVLDKPIMGGEDMSFFLNEAPGTFFFLSNPKDEKNPVSHHNPKFDIEEDLMIIGSKLFVKTALEYLK